MIFSGPAGPKFIWDMLVVWLVSENVGEMGREGGSIESLPKLLFAAF